MKNDQEKTTEKNEVVCFKHKLPINVELGMCEECAVYLSEILTANMGEPEVYIFPEEE